MRRYKSQSNRDVSIASQNLNALDSKQARLFESRKALLCELAYSICGGGKCSEDEIRENYLSALPCDADSKDYFSAISTPEKIDVCREINRLSYVKSSFYESVLGPSESCDESARGRVAYVKNNFTSSAYLIFSKLIPSPRCAYFDSFDLICEDVHSGESEFCILPVETSTDGKLISFYSMIDRYELKILSICTVEHPGGSNFTKFALLGRSLKFPSAESTSGLKFELRISQSLSDDTYISQIICAADVCGVALRRINSMPLPYSDSMISYYAVFDLNRSDLKTFLTYLTLECPQCYAMGIYFEN